MSRNAQAIIRDHFDRYASASSSGDVEAIAAAYAETYVEASPGSVTAHTVDATYRKALVERFELLNQQLGFAGVDIEIASITEFAPSHYIVEARWHMRFDPAGKSPVTSAFSISYVVRLEEDRPKILAYVSHEDEEAVMRRDGVI